MPVERMERRHPKTKRKVVGIRFPEGGGFVGEEVQVFDNKIGYVGKKAGIFDRVTINGCQNVKLRVEDEAVVFDNVNLHGPIRVYGKAKIYGKANIDNHTPTSIEIFGDAQVYENVKMKYGSPVIEEYQAVSKTAKIYGRAKIHGEVEIYGIHDVRIFGDTDIHGKLIISGDIEIAGGKYCSEYTREVKSKEELEKCKCKCNDKKNPLDDLDDLDNMNVVLS